MSPELRRQHLPDTRKAINHKFHLSGADCYIRVGLFEDGTPGEIFITMGHEGSTMRGLLDTIGILFSISLQYGVPLEKLVDKLKGQKFEPNCPLKADSLVDYIAKWMEENFLAVPVEA